MKWTPIMALSGVALAFPGLNSTQGLHSVLAGQTGGEEYLHVNLGMRGSYGTDLIAGQRIQFVDPIQGETKIRNLWTASYDFGLSLGIDPDWDAGVVLPIQHDHFDQSVESFALSRANRASLGDVRFWTAHRLPLTLRQSSWKWALHGMATLNTGSEEIGLIPKELDYLPKNPDQKTSPNTAGVSTVGAALALTYQPSKQGLALHASMGARKATYLNLNGMSMWGMGSEYNWKSLGVFGEYAGETRWGMGPMDDAQRLSLGGRWFSGGWNVSLAGELNPSYDRVLRTVILDRNVADDSWATYKSYGSNPWSISAVLSYAIDLAGDKDHDGVRDHLDRCLGTPKSAPVDKFGCEFDKDGDGVVDRLDVCSATPLGRKVDAVGCELDGDRDGVVDALDQCVMTPAGRKVDERGCELDADQDGVVDALDLCPASALGQAVDTTGCELDTDRDGVVNAMDLCPGTLAGQKVDSLGCLLDEDKDGVGDSVDQCAHTPANRKVDERGCELDGDQDGVVDALDLCPMSAPGSKVNTQGCTPEMVRDLRKLQSEIRFQTGSAVLESSSLPVLDKVVALIQELGDVKLRIEGHTDNKGKAEKNQALSAERAQAVKNYLVSKGIAETLLSVQGFGSLRPIDSNNTPEGRAHNRRTEINPLD